MSDFAAELATYRERLPGLLGSEGAFVVVLGGELSGPFDTYAAALDAGYERYGLMPFLVKEIRAAERVLYFPRDFGRKPAGQTLFIRPETRR